jgi:hypothetical protein
MQVIGSLVLMHESSSCMQVKRIGKYKSAGDQLLRKDMSEPQREQLSALLDGLFDYFLSHVAKVHCCKCCGPSLHGAPSTWRPSQFSFPFFSVNCATMGP